MVEESIKGDYNTLNSSFQLNHYANSPYRKFKKYNFVLGYMAQNNKRTTKSK